MTKRLAVAMVLGGMLVMGAAAVAQESQAVEPPAPMLNDLTPTLNPSSPFPPVDATRFTATFPTVDTVTAFLKQLWGYDANRVFQVAAIMKTESALVSRVVVMVAQKGDTPDKVNMTSFLVLEDGRHGISGDTLFDFGPTPFEEKRALLQAKSAGPAHGAAGKDLMLVEFADFQCPHCKDGQETMDKLTKDYPTARVVYQNFPLPQHNAALDAALYSVCVAKLKPENDNAAFQTYAREVFANQADLTAEKMKATLDAAVVKAGLDAEHVAACTKSQEMKDAVAASKALGEAAGVQSTPTLFVNGRPIPLTSMPYNTLKDVINYQAQLDGIKLPVVATETPAAK